MRFLRLLPSAREVRYSTGGIISADNATQQAE